jgi:hypothetical protein
MVTKEGWLDEKLVRRLGWIGVAMTAPFVVALFFLYGNTPGWSASGSSIIAFYHVHAHAPAVGVRRTGAALFGVLLYGGVFTYALRQLSGQRIWPLAAFGGAVAALAGSISSGAATLALIEGAKSHVTLAGAQGLNALSNADPLALHALVRREPCATNSRSRPLSSLVS